MRFFLKYKRFFSFLAVAFILSTSIFSNITTVRAREIESFVGEVVEAGTELAKVEKQLPARGKVALIKGFLLTLGLSIQLTSMASHITTVEDKTAYQEWSTEMSENISESFERWLEDTDNSGLQKWVEESEWYNTYNEGNQNILETITSAKDGTDLWTVPDFTPGRSDPVSEVEDFISGELGTIGYNTGLLNTFNNFLRNMAQDVQQWILDKNAPETDFNKFIAKDENVKSKTINVNLTGATNLNTNLPFYNFDMGGNTCYIVRFDRAAYNLDTPSYGILIPSVVQDSGVLTFSSGNDYRYLNQFYNVLTNNGGTSNPYELDSQWIASFTSSDVNFMFVDGRAYIDRTFGYNRYMYSIDFNSIHDLIYDYKVPNYLANWNDPDEIPLDFSKMPSTSKDFVNPNSLLNIGNSSTGKRYVNVKGYDDTDLRNMLDYKNGTKTYDDFINDMQKNNDMTMLDKDDVISDGTDDSVVIPSGAIPQGGMIPSVPDVENPSVGQISESANNGINKAPVDLKNVFPFCIPWDLKNAILLLKAKPEIPIFEYHFVVDKLNVDETIVIDFSQFEPMVQVFRVFVTLIFIVSLIVLTRQIIRG